MKGKKKAILTAGVILAALGCLLLAVYLCMGQYGAGRSRNLARRKGVIATCDSVEKESLSAAMAVDGDDQTLTSRWSSENNWEDASHYIQLEFPEEISVSFVVLKWERRNVISYALESSLDGETWEILQRFDTAPAAKQQEIVLDEAEQARFLRLSTYAVSKEEADYSNLYQNVSLYEFEVYEDKPAAYLLETPVIETGPDCGRRLTLPKAPAGYQVSFIGADLEQVIGADGTIYETIQDKEVTVGYRVEDISGREDAREISFTIKVPAGDETVSRDMVQQQNACPQWVIPSIAEWSGGEGNFTLGEDSRILVGTDSLALEQNAEMNTRAEGEQGVQAEMNTHAKGEQDVQAASNTQALWDVAELFNRQCERGTIISQNLPICEGTLEDARPGDIYLGYAKQANGLGEEGYTCDINDICVIEAETVTGIRWGTVTLMQMLSGGEAESVPQGRIRDYPLYTVRGFGIDVARKPVSIDTLYRMMETMSWYKMNDFSLHLNDNTILATSGLTASPEQAMTAASAFRLESDLQNEEGKPLTSQEYAYTKEEIDQLIERAQTYGVNVVPEIDTPAHSLAITSLYPEYALRTSNESVDQIDLGNEEAVALAEELWREALAEDTGAFRKARIVNIGMDEYYGDGEEYRQFLNRINHLVQGAGKTVRMWGSLSNIGGSTQPDPENLQMNIWNTVWADPREMYEAGYSLINMQNSHIYIIPGGGYDWLDCQELYENWAPNKFYEYNQLEIIPVYSPQMLGASYMIWNDMSGNLDIGISEYDLFARFKEPLPVLSMKLWDAPGREGRKSWALDEKEKVYEAGSRCRLYEDTMAAEPDYEIRMKVRLAPDSADGQKGRSRKPDDTAHSSIREGTWQEQILAEGDGAYARWAFYAVEPETGQVGFTREGRTYTFDYTLPKGEWVNLKVRGVSGKVTLYAENREIDTVGSDKPFEEHATFVFPLQRIGRQTSHFEGELELEVAYTEGL